MKVLKNIIMTIKNIDKWLLLFTIILFAIGSVMIFSASNVSFYMRFETSPYKYLIRQMLILGFSFVVCLPILFVNVKFSSRIASIINYGILISLPLLFVFGHVSNHAQSWFKFGVFGIQPSEFLKVFSIIWLARYYYVKKDHLDSYVKSLFPMLLCGLAFLAIVLQPDLGTALIYLAIVGVIFLLSPVASKIKIRIIGIGVGLVLIAGLVLVTGGKNILSERQMSRITSVIEKGSPCDEDNYYTDGNQVCNGYIAINNGGLTGRGLGKSIQKYLYLPEAHTDFIFCIIVEELGVLFGIFIIILYILLLSRIILIGKRSLNNRDALICYGGAFYIFVHIFINLSGIFGIIPMTGVPLPFMSYGGSYTLCLVIILMFVQRINADTKLKMHKEVGN